MCKQGSKNSSGPSLVVESRGDGVLKNCTLAGNALPTSSREKEMLFEKPHSCLSLLAGGNISISSTRPWFIMKIPARLGCGPASIWSKKNSPASKVRHQKEQTQVISKIQNQKRSGKINSR